MTRTGASARRSRGHIRKRGGSYQVLVYAGIDPLTGKDHYLTESTRDHAQAQKVLTRLLATVDEQRNPRTKATLGAALESWLRTHEAEETTLDGYRGYIRRNIEPALGRVPIAKITPQVLEEFYADLRRCRHRCRGGEPAVDHRTAAAHECRTVRHRRKPGRPGPAPHDCAKRAAWSSTVRRTPARRWRRSRSGRFTGSDHAGVLRPTRSPHPLPTRPPAGGMSSPVLAVGADRAGHDPRTGSPVRRGRPF